MLEAVKSPDWVNPALLAVAAAPPEDTLERGWFERTGQESSSNDGAAVVIEELDQLAAEREAARSARTPILACVGLTVLMLVGLPLVPRPSSRPVAVETPAPEVAAQRAAPAVVVKQLVKQRLPAPLSKAAVKAKAKLMKAEVRVNVALAQLDKEKARSKSKASPAVRKAEGKLKASRVDAQKARAEFLAAAK